MPGVEEGVRRRLEDTYTAEGGEGKKDQRLGRGDKAEEDDDGTWVRDPEGDVFMNSVRVVGSSRLGPDGPAIWRAVGEEW
mmetsp:Transcript_26959/g.53783  ORF Transcript_26959/g.53783 Transcript_26959/m.53783 type:complete len:80 (-) Transcript_26959:414-653(-)|eukprot:CAMPEP_0197550212 /NCGR_PEP_ID=MMETSP1320-20131121/3885_1 /TAXON_ID=91990 /ORGANISM="Bolidomonas sp., Strain RCC2347" /LENGTH=79 /DNA_ID=CAMNT_0043110553 /DNA_START=281 /DNA_END=520 /DNA_ORIENTATION=-